MSKSSKQSLKSNCVQIKIISVFLLTFYFVKEHSDVADYIVIVIFIIVIAYLRFFQYPAVLYNTVYVFLEHKLAHNPCLVLADLILCLVLIEHHSYCWLWFWALGCCWISPSMHMVSLFTMHQFLFFSLFLSLLIKSMFYWVGFKFLIFIWAFLLPVILLQPYYVNMSSSVCCYNTSPSDKSKVVLCVTLYHHGNELAMVN